MLQRFDTNETLTYGIGGITTDESSSQVAIASSTEVIFHYRSIYADLPLNPDIMGKVSERV